MQDTLYLYFSVNCRKPSIKIRIVTSLNTLKNTVVNSIAENHLLK